MRNRFEAGPRGKPETGPRKKALIVDYGNVYAISGSPVTLFKKQFDRTQRKMFEKIWRREVKPTWRKLVKGEISSTEFWEFVGRTYGKKPDWKELEQRCIKEAKLNKGIVQIILAAKQKGVITAMLTNNVKEWFELAVQRWDFSIFDHVVASQLVGMRKPEKNIYVHTCSTLDVQPGNCFFVDDGASNVSTAIRLGMFGFHFNHRDVEGSNTELEHRLRTFGIL